MTPLEIACRACAAQPGESCFWTVGNSPQRMPCGPHPERVEDAAYWNHAADPAPEPKVLDEAIARAVDEVL